MSSSRERLLAKVDTTSGPDACWPFTGALKPKGYGNFWLEGEVVGAHVASYRLFVGEIPPLREIDHLCHDPETCLGGVTCPHRRCCNPAHLAVVEHRVNSMRSAGVCVANAAKTHCGDGHEFTPENTYRAPGSPDERHCRKCAAKRQRARRLLQRLEIA